jgi:hypothetical protein
MFFADARPRKFAHFHGDVTHTSAYVRIPLLPMRIGAIILAFVAVAIGAILKWYLTRKWQILTVTPSSIFFPKLCPVCLSQTPTETVEEKSPSRRAAYYIFVTRRERWSAAVPYCSECNLKLNWGKVIGIVFSALCAAGAFILMPPNVPDSSVLVYLLFGYPVYVIATIRRKGVILKSGSATGLTMAIQRPEYFEVLASTVEQAKTQARAAT